MFSYYPMKLGDLVTIGAGSVVEAATIGNGVEIGKGCIIVRPPFSRSRSSHSEFRHGRVIPPYWRRSGGVGDAGESMVTDCLDAEKALTAASAAQGPLVILKDFCKVADGAVVGAGTVIPSLTEWGGSPGESAGRNDQHNRATLSSQSLTFDTSPVTPARLIGQLPESTPEAVESIAKNAYLNFRPD
jgi:carbonic anhydrase/acetyltransferase-like protein (isoleucine patch superfamily)